MEVLAERFGEMPKKGIKLDVVCYKRYFKELTLIQ